MAVLEEQLRHELRLERSGWIAARAFFRAPDGLLRQAHTSPIYVSIDEKPTAYANDARYMLEWIDVLENIARSNPDRFPNRTAQEGVLANYEEAREIYLRIIEDAQRYWGD